MLSTFLGNCGVLMVPTLALSAISAGTAEKNGWKNVWISKVTGRNWKTTSSYACEVRWRLVRNCIFPLTADNEPGSNGAFFLPSFLEVTTMLMTSSLGKARKMDLGFRLVVLSITGLKMCSPTEFSVCNENTHF